MARTTTADILASVVAAQAAQAEALARLAASIEQLKIKPIEAEAPAPKWVPTPKRGDYADDVSYQRAFFDAKKAQSAHARYYKRSA